VSFATSYRTRCDGGNDVSDVLPVLQFCVHSFLYTKIEKKLFKNLKTLR